MIVSCLLALVATTTTGLLTAPGPRMLTRPLSPPSSSEPPVLAKIDEAWSSGVEKPPPSEFDLNMGRCIDTLRQDLPEFLNRDISWDIYTSRVEVVDPSGVVIKGLDAYRNVHSSLRLFRQIALDDWEITFRLRYDWSKSSIVVQWNSRWYVRGRHEPLHVDAISTFDLNDDGLIYRHRIDRVIMNTRSSYALAPDNLARTLLAKLAADRGQIPVLACCRRTQES